MNNSDLEMEIMLRFGSEKTTTFCEMISFMYELLHKDAVERGLASGEYDEFDYGYDAIWWKDKYNELKDRQNANKRIIARISESNRGS